jgi:steroid delta-isomerase-like uncharacterized protein
MIAESYGEEVLSRHIAAMNGHDPQAVTALYSNDCCWAEPPGSSVLVGKQSLGRYLTLLFNAFPDLTISPVRSLFSGNALVVEWRAEGTHSGVFMGIRGRGLRVEAYGASVLDVEDGKIRKSHHYCDSATLLRHLGQPLEGEPL